MLIQGKNYCTVWMDKDKVLMINQSLIPHKFEIYSSRDYLQTANAIQQMIIRGAPAIGAAAAYGLAQAALHFKDKFEDFPAYIKKVKAIFQNTRPTAFDLFHAVDEVEKAIFSAESIEEAQKKAVKAAADYADYSAEMCKKIGEHGNSLIKKNAKILTHCNAGALATVDYGTALSPIRFAHKEGKNPFVYVDETRPRMQGSRLTAFELAEEGIAHAVIADNAAGFFIQKKEIDLVITGADRIAANGDVANKIGTYEKAVLAKENNIPFYVAAPLSTIDFKCRTGADIPIEERTHEEVLYMFGWSDKGNFERVRISPEKSTAKNPAFDVTPSKYIRGIITEKGIFKPEEIKNLK